MYRVLCIEWHASSAMYRVACIECRMTRDLTFENVLSFSPTCLREEDTCCERCHLHTKHTHVARTQRRRCTRTHPLAHASRVSFLEGHTVSFLCELRTHTHAHTRVRACSLSLSHTHTHTRTQTHTHTHIHTYSHSLSLSHTHTHTHTHNSCLCFSHTHPFSLSHTHKHKHTHAPTQRLADRVCL